MTRRWKAAGLVTALVAGLGCQAAVAAPDDLAATASQEWRSYVEPLLALGARLVPQIGEPGDAQLRQELYRASFSALAAGYLALTLADPAHPDFIPFTGQLLNLLGPNPDDVYLMSPLADDGVYRVSGYRGSVHTILFQFAGGDFVTRGEGKTLGTTLANHDVDEIKIGKDGAFEVLISRERPAGYKGNWWPLPLETTNVVVRQIAYDWVKEVDGRLAIERLDTPAIKPRPSAAQIESELRQLATWTEAYVTASNRFVEGFAARVPINEVGFIGFGDDGGITTQKYLEGLFDLAPDEALILETEVPKQCKYWSFQLTDERWTSYDWINRKTSINGHSAHIDKDGKFRAVLAARDPGVPNWLDTVGYRRGVMQGRWKACSSYPQPVTRKVKIDELRRYLPQDTPTVTAEARDAELRLRRTGAQLRRRW